MITDGNQVTVYKILFPLWAGGSPIVDWAYGASSGGVIVSSFIDEKSFSTDYSVMFSFNEVSQGYYGIIFRQGVTFTTKLLYC